VIAITLGEMMRIARKSAQHRNRARIKTLLGESLFLFCCAQRVDVGS